MKKHYKKLSKDFKLSLMGSYNTCNFYRYKMFFIDVIPVTPNRFRPENKLGDQTFLHGHTVVLTKLL